MANNEDRIRRLSENLEILAKRQEAFGKVIRKLREELYLLKNAESETKIGIESQVNIEERKEENHIEYKVPSVQKTQDLPKKTIQKPSRFPEMKTNFEKFIGENLISKIGILIIILGVGIGAKYAIDNELVSPLTRIILGYLVGLGLLGFAFKLKPKYESFSAVLLSGAMAIMYFITYSAYSFYGLLPQGMAFALMVLFTVFTVVAALNYNKQVIALIGLVGAHAVPFLLSSGSGQTIVLFSYMAIINIGILAVGVKRYWKLLYYSAFFMTWLIFATWFGMEYKRSEHFSLALIFSTIFFATFYVTFLANKLVNQQKFGLSDVVLLLLNSFFFYGFGLATLNDHDTGKELLGVFTLANAVLHFVISYFIYKRRLADQNLQYLVSGLVLVFITIAIPIQLDGSWVTLLWAGEAALMFWIGRTKNVPVYEKLSYALMILAFGSLLQDWSTAYNQYYLSGYHVKITPIFNIFFLTSALFIALFAFIYKLSGDQKYDDPTRSSQTLVRLFSYLIPAILLFTIYAAFKVEIENYWHQLYADSEITTTGDDGQILSYHSNYDLNSFKYIWGINYSLLFLTILSYVNIKHLKNRLLGTVTLILSVIAVGAFLTKGLYEISELRESYISQSSAEFYQIDSFNITIRYLSFVFVAGLLYAMYRYTQQTFMQGRFRKYFDLVLHLTILWILSSELIHWLDMSGSPENYKIGLSILWGSYSLLLIVLGIWKKKKHWRLGAIALFALTLMKLFFYDISHLDTISKTIVFVSLGVLLLIISFLYNKYKHAIFDDEE